MWLFQLPSRRHALGRSPPDARRKSFALFQLHRSPGHAPQLHYDRVLQILTQRSASPVSPGTLKKYRDGTHRIISPAETLESVRRFLPAIGITRVADITGLDVIGIPVVTVCRPNSRSVAVSLGKGLDLAAAQASGVMEATEAFMAERITQPLVLASVNDLRSTHRLVDVDLLPRPADSIYHPDLPILWIEGRELFSGTSRWVPYEMVHTAYTLPTPNGTGCFIASSNGLASGNHLLEAISHAICETVERDAATLHSVRAPEETALRRIDPQTVDDPGCREALDRLDRAGMSTEIWDMTTDIGIPAFTCLIAEAGSGRHPVRMIGRAEGMGCHPDRNVALLRALTEAAQSRLASISGGRDETAPWEPEPEPEPEASHGPDSGLGVGPARSFTAVPAFESRSLDEDVSWELSGLRTAGIREAVVVDLTREEFGIPVVRVIVPGLEGPTTTVSSCRLGARAMNLAASGGSA
jgi:YcaO-like protein with predicted kinase domain